MKVCSVVGTQGSGKTTTIEAVIAELRRRNYRVGSVKDIHFEAFAIDTPGSNTHRHRVAGAELVTARGNHETDLLYPGRLPVPVILRHYKEYDWVVLEGVLEPAIPAVICTLDKLAENSICISGKLSTTLCSHELPMFNALDDITGLCDFLEHTVPDYLECFDPKEPACDFDITLKLDGKDIRMVPFVQKVLRNAVLGVAKELEGFEEGAAIEISLKAQ